MSGLTAMQMESLRTSVMDSSLIEWESRIRERTLTPAEYALLSGHVDQFVLTVDEFLTSNPFPAGETSTDPKAPLLTPEQTAWAVAFDNTVTWGQGENPRMDAMLFDALGDPFFLNGGLFAGWRVLHQAGILPFLVDLSLIHI